MQYCYGARRSSRKGYHIHVLRFQNKKTAKILQKNGHKRNLDLLLTVFKAKKVFWSENQNKQTTTKTKKRGVALNCACAHSISLILVLH